MRLGEFVKWYRHSIEDVEYPYKYKVLIKAYDEAAHNVYRAADKVAREGTRASVRELQWWEGVTFTLEECLSAIADDEDDEVYFQLPTPPDFTVF